MPDDTVHDRGSASDVATVLAALRLFQEFFLDQTDIDIADKWPEHFVVREDGSVDPAPLGTDDIDTLCERINTEGLFGPAAAEVDNEPDYELDVEDPHQYTNYYVHCGVQWWDEWSCWCNDECPECGGEIEPYASWENNEPVMNIHDFEGGAPEGGWPADVTRKEELDGWPSEEDLK